MATLPTPPNNTRIGFHYFPDTDHYRESDLNTWLPELRSVGATWLVLLAPSRRAIPEYFLNGLLEAGIEPILHFPFNLAAPPEPQELAFLLASYARWGAHYTVFFDRPNSRAAWPAAAWAQSDLVERFLDRFIPLASAAVEAGLAPVFPPLEPGGGYWDTAFLRAALQGLGRRGRTELLNQMILSAQACAGDHPLDWGSGGPERWPDARPYPASPTGQDQRGFRIYDWYSAIASAVTGKMHPMLLLGVNSRPTVQAPAETGRKGSGAADTTAIQRNLAIARAVAAAPDPAGTRRKTGLESQLPRAEGLEPVPPQILAVNYWLLAAESSSPHAAFAWFEPDGRPRPVAMAMRKWVARDLQAVLALAQKSGPRTPAAPSQRPIAHYLLLPSYEWGVADWHLNAVRPYVKKHRPTIGFSLAEAACAEHVTVVGGPHHFTDADLDALRASGCLVERINGDGTSIATFISQAI
jgi:hypothetical protein